MTSVSMFDDIQTPNFPDLVYWGYSQLFDSWIDKFKHKSLQVNRSQAQGTLVYHGFGLEIEYRYYLLLWFKTQDWNTYSLFTWSKRKWLFWRAGFFPVNRAFGKLFRLLLLAGKKPALQNSHFCFYHVNKLIVPIPKGDEDIPSIIWLHLPNNLKILVMGKNKLK